MSPSEALTVDELNAEMREVAGDYRFLEALRSEVRHTSRVMGTYVASKLAPAAAGASGGGAGAAAGAENVLQQQQAEGREGRDYQQQQQQQQRAKGPDGEEGVSIAGLVAASQPKPFPFVVPIVARSSQVLFDEANRCTRVRCGGAGVFGGPFWGPAGLWMGCLA